MTDTEKAALEARIDELCAEVERLRVANAAFTGRSIRAGDKMACLEAENAKLRELAAKMAKALRAGSEWCDRECIVVFGCDGMDECLITKELRELGIEVE